ncbi:hypothetical protein CFC21_100812 [Triticum aestivum]|uniref:DUF295 domain-containing protein n=2 Tax=Triticum aestivum TaxID=4565 RepID=A0A3B6RT61_WHEAT|nr:hypothetical protein CFC21_100812 [Triticum aestivum]
MSCPTRKAPAGARDGRVLFDWISLMNRSELVEFYHDGRRLTRTKRERCKAADFHLAICDPLSRRYVLLPTIPEDLAAQPHDCLWEFEPILAPKTNNNNEEEPFKVICIGRCRRKVILFVFRSTTMQWYVVESPDHLSLEDMSCFDCVRDCFYSTRLWFWSDHLMVLDTRTLKFSTVYFLTSYHRQLGDTDPSYDNRRPNEVAEGREGAIEMFTFVCQHGSYALHHTSLQDNSHEWKLQKIVQLPGQYHAYSISTVGAAEGFLFFQGALPGIEIGNVDCYSMDIKTYEIAKVCIKTVYMFDRKRAIPYFSFPRLLSEPTI